MTTYNHNPRTLDDETANNTIREAAPQLLAALIDLIARMEENKPAPAKKRDLNAAYNNAVFYRDLETARALVRPLTA